MAKVYRATDLTLERQVAVKLMNPELRARAASTSASRREAKLVGQLAERTSSPSTTPAGQHLRFPSWSMEYSARSSLRERLAKEGPLPSRLASNECPGALALIHAHDKGVVHRDISRTNIFLVNQERRAPARPRPRLRHRPHYRRSRPRRYANPSRAIVGTPRYMSPEQLAAAGRCPVGHLQRCLVIH